MASDTENMWPYETHLVREDAVLVFVPVMNEPVNALNLKGHKLELGALS